MTTMLSGFDDASSASARAVTPAAGRSGTR
jgi:hypothetical protein